MGNDTPMLPAWLCHLGQAICDAVPEADATVLRGEVSTTYVALIGRDLCAVRDRVAMRRLQYAIGLVADCKEDVREAVEAAVLAVTQALWSGARLAEAGVGARRAAALAQASGCALGAALAGSAAHAATTADSAPAESATQLAVAAETWEREGRWLASEMWGEVMRTGWRPDRLH